MSVSRLTSLAAVAGAGLALTVVVAAQAPTAPRTYRITADALAAPSADNHTNPAKVVARPADASLELPAGFTATPLATGGFKRPRNAAQAPNGDIFIVDSGPGTVWVLRDADKNGTIGDGERHEFFTGLKQPFGIAFHRTGLFVANTDAVVRFAYAPGDLKASAAPVTVTPLPNGPTGHWTRNLAFSPDGRSFYVTVGSSHNIDVDPDPLRATVLKFALDGSKRETVMTGVRNGVGLAFHPATKEAWITVQERGGLGDELVPDFLGKVVKGRSYGWPYAYIGAHEDPRHAGKMPDAVKKAVVPELLFEPHSSAMTMAFYTGTAFPTSYRNGAFVALRGSSERVKRTGYKIVYVPFAKGQPTGEYQDFATGFMKAEDSPEVWGRPVGLTVLQDGSLLLVEDGNGSVWRIAYGK